MGFLDNSGDIILDAVLTDLGRKRLAQGNFTISKFALGDEEIDYSLYDKNHPSGSAYYDLEILQTPILESFTNNSSTMKSFLVTYANGDILYLPVLDLNQTVGATLNATSKALLLTTNSTTRTHQALVGGNAATAGLLLGDTATGINTRKIVLDQILAIDGAAEDTRMAADLIENEFTVYADYRLLRITDALTSKRELSTAFVDDDYIAAYQLSGENFLSEVPIEATGDFISDTEIRGEIGPRLSFGLNTSTDLKNSDLLFNRVGTSGATLATLGLTAGAGGAASGFYRFIDTVITVEGNKNGFSIDIPIRIFKKQ
jgi:hypothetical protein